MINWLQTLRRGGADCQECSEVYNGNPPCDTCEKTEPFICNVLAVNIWTKLDVFERVDGRVPLTSMITAVEAYGGDVEDLDKIQVIEAEMLKFYAEREKHARDKTKS